MNFLIILNILSSIWGKFDEIAQANRYKTDGEKAYLGKNYVLAINKYHFLIYDLHSTDEHIRMNLAHAYYKNNDMIQASYHYKKLISSSNIFISSISNQQLGLITALHKQNKKALIFFKEAIKANPDNDAARFNYELTMKIIKEEKHKNNDELPHEGKKESDKNLDGINNTGEEKNTNGTRKKTTRKNDPEGNIEFEDENFSYGENHSDENNTDKRQMSNSNNKSNSNEIENSNKEELELNEKGVKQREALISQRLKKINMTEEKAKMILEAMRNSEIQYLQQIRKKGKAGYDKNKPDW